MTPRIRLDDLLVQRDLVASRSRGADAIRRGAVTVEGKTARKAGQRVAADAQVRIDDAASHFVSRSALKLDHALGSFDFDPAGRSCLDIGASTGGFTQVLLERGAAHVTAVDVGKDQLATSIRDNPKVTALEGTDARKLTRDHVPENVTAIVADVSFISLTKAIPEALKLAAPGCWFVALIKPQFEVGLGHVGKGGIVRDETAREMAAMRVRDWLESQSGWEVKDVVPSPIKGGNGNIEFLIGAVLIV